MTVKSEKFTPGPWRVDHDMDGDFVIGSDAKPIIAITNLDHEDDEANGRLIAAAPQLYEALNVVLTITNQDDGGRTWRNNAHGSRLGVFLTYAQLSAIEAALAKAKGEL